MGFVLFYDPPWITDAATIFSCLFLNCCAHWWVWLSVQQIGWRSCAATRSQWMCPWLKFRERNSSTHVALAKAFGSLELQIKIYLCCLCKVLNRIFFVQKITDHNLLPLQRWWILNPVFDYPGFSIWQTSKTAWTAILNKFSQNSRFDFPIIRLGKGLVGPPGVNACVPC